ncbi:MAG: precorrin-6y C5,15-methyltransferase (decarboxylating) subunit CbiE [Pseudomonadota bacterium]
MHAVQIVGLGLGPGDLTPRMLEAARGAEVLAGGRRHLSYFPDFPGRTVVLAGDLGARVEDIAQAFRQGLRVTVLASGDPGFFGIAARLAGRLGPENIVIHPNVCAFQAAFARLKKPWQNATLVSVHGRGRAEFWSALAVSDLVAVYTEPRFGPAEIAAAMIERGQAGWRMHVCEDLGADDERVGVHEPAAAAAGKFSGLNVVVLERTEKPTALGLGQPESRYEHEAGLITKAEIRAAALGKLDLGPNLTLWDLGAGSGSVGIEASRLLPGGRIICVERDPARVEQIKANRKKFGAAQVEIVRLDLPEGLGELPRPDRVFIGGGGDALASIIDLAAEKITDGGVVVAAVVKLDGLETARRAMAVAGLAVEIVQIQVSRGAPLGGDLYFKALNPVWLVTGRKDGSSDE